MARTHLCRSFLLLCWLSLLAPMAHPQPDKRKPISHPSYLYQVSTRDNRSGEKRIGFIDRTGKLVIGFDRLPKTTQIVGEFHDGRAVIYIRDESGAEAKGNMNHTAGYIDETGEVVIAPRFDLARDFSEGLAYVEVDEKGFRGFIDRAGKSVVKVDAPAAKDFHEGLAAVGTGKQGGEWGYIDRSGSVVIKRHSFADDFSEGLAGVAVNGRYGFINKQGVMVISARFDVRAAGRHPEVPVSSGRFSEGLACVRVRGLYGYIDKKGDFLISPQFSHAQDFSEGLAWVTTDGKTNVVNKVGWVDKSGRWVVTEVDGLDLSSGLPELISYANEYFDWRYSEGLVPFIIYSGNRALRGYMNQRGQVVIKPRDFGKVGPFVGGIAWVAFNSPGDSTFQEDYGYIDKQGQFIWRSK